jgi:hypothetical protein
VRARLDEGIEPVELAKCPANSWGEKQTAKLVQTALGLSTSTIEKTWQATLDQAPQSAKPHVEEVLNFIREKREKARTEHWFWREVPLRKFIKCTPVDLPNPEARLRDLWWKTSADVLITTRAPDYRPVLAIEYDSDLHDTGKQRETDAKRDEIFRRVGIPLLRVRQHHLNGRDPLAHDRLEAAVRIVVERDIVENRHDVKRMREKIDRLWGLALRRATAGEKSVPKGCTTAHYLTAVDAASLFELQAELDMLLGDDEHWEIQAWEQDAAIYHGVSVTLRSVIETERGCFARVSCSSEGMAPREISGDCIRLAGAENALMRYAERKIAIGAAFDLAIRAIGKL